MTEPLQVYLPGPGEGFAPSGWHGMLPFTAVNPFNFALAVTVAVLLFYAASFVEKLVIRWKSVD